ncbi:NRDE-2, necessary for RNA interference-domain-containing protein [Irpex rosettiformis]|uniref:NRDE-2, necessary for RNA interference-domain-containing protein n=1 Tax=Irpex rosettiformis TaxID=378272 RepID=A0ACB8UKS2_9APHY|nr:NRDE-2, necessary for RNA interference-domain-containing protein [Irpex rosettiformis]
MVFSDRKGDILNIKYGRLHAGDIPRYNIVGRGRRILGLGNALLVLHRGRQGVEVGISGSRRKVPDLTDSSTRHMLRTPPTKRLLSSAEDKYKYAEVDGFLRLPSGRSREAAHSGRDITVTAQDSQASESSSEEELSDDFDDSDTSSSTARQEALKSLEVQLSTDPTSVQTWILLLAHTLAGIPPDTKNAQKVRADVTLSVLARALSAHPSNAQSSELRLKYLSACEYTWTPEALNKEWETSLKFGTTELWIQWLDWRIRTATKGVVGISEDIQRVFKNLSRDDENGRLRAFWRVSIALRDSGFVERANALFQAQAELLFRKPLNLYDAPFDNQLDRLEVFWDSEVPRAGEAGASGWAAWELSGQPEPPSSSGRPAATKSVSLDPYLRWALDEDVYNQPDLSLPTRSINENIDEDPYSTVLFSDIRSFLIDLRSLPAKESYRLIWLSFLGLHIPGLSSSIHEIAVSNMDDKWSATHFASSYFLSSIFPADNTPAITADAQAGVLFGREREYSSIFGPVKHWGFDTLTPLEGIGSDKYSMLTRQDLKGVNLAMVRQVFQQCRTTAIDSAWDALHLAFEGALDLKVAIKISKYRLATDQDSLYRWASHAMLERMRGRLDEARKVYSTVLPPASLESPGFASLWWDWAELEWHCQSKEAAIQVILRSTDTTGGGTLAVLRCKRRIEELYQGGAPERWRERQAWIKLRVLLELLTSSIDSVIFILDAEIERLIEGTISHESLTMASLLLLYVHGSVLCNPIPPSLLRDRAERAISQYPSNTIILGLFLEAEKGQVVWGKVRLVLGETSVAGLPREKDLPRRIAEIWAAGWEKGRWKAEEERVRTGLAAATQDERTRGSAILWRVYLEFEIRAGQLQRAKKLLFRAVGECPLAKELYLIAFVQLRSVFNSKELNELGDTMAERGIRLREGLDEALEVWSESHGRVKGMDDDESEDYGEEEIERNADELRRLKPY